MKEEDDINQKMVHLLRKQSEYSKLNSKSINIYNLLLLHLRVKYSNLVYNIDIHLIISSEV